MLEGLQGHVENLTIILSIMESYEKKMREFCASHQERHKNKGGHGDSQTRRVQALPSISCYLISVSPVLTSSR